LGGTLLNIVTVALGSALGLLIGNRLPERIQQSVITAIGLVTFFVGISNAEKTGNIIIPLISLIFGVILGELLRIDLVLERFGGWLAARVPGKAAAHTTDQPTTDQRARLINGFVTASLVFCIGPLTFVGSIQDGMGLTIGFQQLAIKSILDLFTAMAFASSLGVGVVFSIITILLIQGGLALAGSLIGNFMSTPMINEMTAVGGLLLIGLALVLLDLKKPRMANFLPALVIAPLLVALAAALNITIYPHIP
jgi:uncharacterized membrane protein YqgA involved in biofilm formation